MMLMQFPTHDRVWCARRCFLLALGLTSCVFSSDEKDRGSGDSVSATMNVSFPDGSSTQVRFTRAALGGTMEFDPDDRPEMRRVLLQLESAAGEGVDCRIELEVDGYCGAGSYPLGVSAVGIATLFDCPGVSDDYESVINLSDGAVELRRLAVDAERGATAGAAYPVELQGSLSHSFDGIELDASFDIVGQIDGRDAEEQECGEFTPLPDGGSGGSGSGGSGSGGSDSGGSGSGGSDSGGSGSGGSSDGSTPEIIAGDIACQRGSDSSAEMIFVELQYTDPQGDFTVEQGRLTAHDPETSEPVDVLNDVLLCLDGQCVASWIINPLRCDDYRNSYEFSATVTDETGLESERLFLPWRD